MENVYGQVNMMKQMDMILMETERERDRRARYINRRRFRQMNDVNDGYR